MLEARNIHKNYTSGKEELPVLKGIDLKLEKGSFTALVGPSGAGKSTLLHILGGLDSPSQGEVIFEEENIYKLKDALLCRIRNKKIGFVFQFYHLLSEFTVLENVMMPALISRPSSVYTERLVVSEVEPSRGVVRRPSKEEALKLLTQVGLSDRITHFPNQLSGGEKQRVAIARALMNKPALLLCDEPTGNLDSETGGQIIALLKKINQEEQMTLVLVTHNQALAQTADRVYHLRDGVLEK